MHHIQIELFKFISFMLGGALLFGISQACIFTVISHKTKLPMLCLLGFIVSLVALFYLVKVGCKWLQID